MNSVYDTINYIDYGLMGIIIILSLGLLCIYRDLVDARYNKEHWKIIALKAEELRKVLDNAEAEMEKRVDEMFERIKKKNAE